MRIKAPCAVCVNTLKDAYQLQILDGELDDSGLVYVTCSEGHESVVVYDSRRYEVLMQSATSALVDGYTNEAISSYATALERAYEFYIRVILRANNIENAIADKAWKMVSSQSERQLGAFHFLHLLDQGNTLELDKTIPEIRNKVVHKGKIARTKETIDFAERIYNRIRSIENSLGKHDAAAKKEQEYELINQQKSVPNGMDHIVLKAFHAKVDQNNDFAGYPDTFNEYLAAVKQSKKKGWQ